MPVNEHACAVVTGTSSGIGLAIAQRLLAQGWQVHGLDQHVGMPMVGAFTGWQVDLTDDQQLDAVLTAVLQSRPPQALVHAAGVLRVGHLGSLDAKSGELMWRLHVEVATRLANRLLPAMQATGEGRFVLLGSRVSGGIAGRSQYAATKAALVSLARSWAAESIGFGVTVNVISPAATDTPMLHDPARSSAMPRLPPIGRLIQPDEVAGLVLFLLGEDAAAITGQDIAVCGGASVRQ